MPSFSDFQRKNNYSHAHILSKKHNAIMPIFCPKNVNSLKHNALISFLLVFHGKPPAVIPIFDQKNVNSVKTTVYYGPKMSIACPFFPIFHEKNTRSHSHIFVEKRLFSENHTALMPIFCRKSVHLLKNTVLPCHLLQIFHEKTHASTPIFDQTSLNSVKTTLYYGLKKSIGYPFFWFFTKNNWFHDHILWKNVHSLKNTLYSFSKFVKKPSILSKTQRSRVIF